MARSAAFFFSVLCLFSSYNPLHAQTVMEFDSVALLNAATITGTNSVYLASYYCTGTSPCVPDGDGGEGLLVTHPTTCTQDNGSVFTSHGPGLTTLCWYRQNLNGDLRQWGVTTRSPYDASISASPSPANSLINTAYGVLAKIGITEINTHQVSIFLSEGGSSPHIIVPGSGSFSCGAAGGGNYTGGVYAGLNLTSGVPLNTKPGTIFLDHGTFIEFGGNAGTNQNQDSSSIHNCIIAPQWLQTSTSTSMTCTGGVDFTYPAAAYADLEAIRANMVLCGDQALFFNSASGAHPHDLWIYGFDNPIHLFRSDHFILTNALLDGDICVYSDHGGGITKLNEVSCDSQLTRQVLTHSGGGSISMPPDNTTCWQVAHANGNLCPFEYWQISSITVGAANSSGHNCHLVLVLGAPDSPQYPSAPKVSLLTTGLTSIVNSTNDPISYPMWISNLDAISGGLSCVGRDPHPISSVVYHNNFPLPDMADVELENSEFDKINATATWDKCTQPPCLIRIVSSSEVDAMATGELVTSTAATIPSNSSVVSVVREAKGPDPYNGYIAEIYVNTALPASVTTDTAIQLDGFPNSPATRMYVPTPMMPCDNANQGQCATLQASERVVANNTISAKSPAGLTSASLPESNIHPYSAGFLNDDTDDMCLFDAFSFGHHYGFFFQDDNNICLVNKDGDDNGEIDDQGGEFFVVSGGSNQLSAQGAGASKSGVGIVNDLYQLTQYTGTGVSNPINALTSTAIGATVTLQSGNTSLFPSDQGPGHTGGKGTAEICGVSACNGSNPLEYVTYEIVNSTQLTLLARGRFFSQPNGGFLTGFPLGSMFYTAQVSRPTGCTSISSTATSSTAKGLNQVEQIGGCLQLVNFKSSEDKNIFISHNATATQLSNASLPQAPFIYEDATAQMSMTGCANVLLLPASWNCPQSLAHGQVRLTFLASGTPTQLQLCPYNGTGLIVNNQLLSIPMGCLILKDTSATGTSAFDYIYANSDSRGVAAVVSDSGSVQVQTVDATPYHTGDQVFATCYGIGGTIAVAADIAQLATMKSSSIFDFNSATFVTGAHYTTGGMCTILGLVASATGHSSAPNGVETESTDLTKTLVGAAYVNSSGHFQDTGNAREVASWFNRATKTCSTSLSGDVSSLTSTSYAEVSSSNRCSFITLGASGLASSLGNTQWSTSGWATDTVANTVVSTSAGFDGTASEPEFTADSSLFGMSIAVSGSRPSLTEALHYITMLYKVNSSSNPATYKGSSTIEVRLQQ